MAIIRIEPAKPAYQIAGKSRQPLPEREVYPGNEDFGVSGWYFPKSCRADAEAKFEELLNSIPDPTPHRT